MSGPARLAVLLGFIGLPLLLALGVIGFLEEEAGRAAHAAQLAQMREALAETLAYGDPLQRLEQDLERQTRALPSLTAWKARVPRLLRTHAGRLELYLFHPDGTPEPLPGLPAPPRVAARQFMQVLLDPGAPHNPRLVATFGGHPEAPVRLAATPRRLCLLMTGGLRNWGGWWPLTGPGGRRLGHVIAFLHKVRGGEAPLLDEAVERATRRHGRYFHLGWRDPGIPEVLRPPRRRGGPPRPWAAGLAAQLDRLPWGECTFTRAGRTGLLVVSPHGEQVFCLARYPPDRSTTFDLARFACQLTAVLTALLSVAVASGRWLLPLGLRGRLTLLLMVGGGIPLAILLTTAVIDHQDRVALELDRLRRASAEHLTRIDQELSRDYRRLARSYQRFLQRLESVPTASLPAALAPLRAHNERRRAVLVQMLVIDTAGRLLFCDDRSFRGDRAAGHTAIEVNRSHALQLLRGYNGDLAEDLSDEDADRPAAPAGGASFELLTGTTGKAFFKHLLAASPTLQNLQIFDREVPAFLGILRNPAADGGKAARAIMTVLHDKDALQRRFLAGITRVLATRSAFERGPARPSALDRDREAPPAAPGGDDRPIFLALPVTPRPTTPSFPRPGLEHHRALRALADLAATTRLPTHQPLRLSPRLFRPDAPGSPTAPGSIAGTREFLVTAVPGQHLDGYILLLAHPLQTLHEATRVLNARLVGLTIALLLLAWLVARIASTLLLAPLAGLGRGLDALVRRDFGVRLEPGRVEELAGLATRFNQVMEGFRELQIARTVQEHLWPSAPLLGPDWSLHGLCRTATDLGGDHHDWFPLPDGRVLLAVGDVAGHGIPSALTEAAAKVLLALHAARTPSPRSILEAMNRDLLAQSEKPLSMTMWLGLFDPRTRTLTCASAGHPFPILLTEGKPGELLKNGGLPLGIRRQMLYREITLDWRAGGTLVVYSDGLVESHSPAGEMLSFPRLLAEAERRRQRPPPELARELIDLALAWSGTAAPEDDLTVVVLRAAPRPVDQTASEGEATRGGQP
ncbi:MAG: Serine phosphatase RsbU, regulator of sigma subunit [Candidatus Ozemobacter sibiricus]|uniref:Serine phosphatase RsbU, regulator of sigma subunit n=1 Tax=Candidatus Ozemobacter sibiricus TaxID=2268124 RepID=A0A367ZQG3_9BACT|nr:MAG: Serine phosphatase RsbU, regulator of sigma subunit [Candidatus Ozemobacter sibiricus]